MKSMDLVIKGDEFLEGDLDAAFNQLETEKSEYIDIESIKKIYN
jgi:starch synthase